MRRSHNTEYPKPKTPSSAQAARFSWTEGAAIVQTAEYITANGFSFWERAPNPIATTEYIMFEL